MATPKKTNSTNKTKGKASYQCQECNKTCADASTFHQHKKLHSDIYPYSCELCSYKCKIKKYLSRHVKKKHGKANGPECPVCGKVFHYDCNLKSHMRVHTGEKPYKCPVCKKAFSSSYCLSMHKLIHTEEKPFQCKFCPYACRDSSTLRRHQERHMGIIKTYPCTKCKKVFKTSLMRRIHTDEAHYGLETRKFPCKRCGKAFKTLSFLNTHTKSVHEGVGRRDCEICGRSISRTNMITHLQTHVDIRPYKCIYAPCDKSFKDRSTFRKHLMIHIPERHYQCDLCECRFPRKSRLKEHRMKHIGEGGYICDYCGISYVKKSFITFHIRTKHGPDCEKYICDDCGAVSYTRKSMTLHLSYGHGTELDRKCGICSKVVETSNILKEHYFKLHQVKFIVQKRKIDQIIMKEEPIEVNAEFEFQYEIQKVEMDERILDTEYADSAMTLAYSTRVLEEDMSRNMAEAQEEAPMNEFDELFSTKVMNPSTRQDIAEPEYVDAETTQAYSERVLQEDLSRSLLGRQDQEIPENSFDQLFINQAMEKPKKINKKKKKKKAPLKNLKRYADKHDLETVRKTIEKMLSETRQRKELEDLENMRQMYNIRIQSANKNGGKKESTKITYFKKAEAVQDINNSRGDDIIINKNDKLENENDEYDTIQNDKPDVDRICNNISPNDENDTTQNHKPNDDKLHNDNHDESQKDKPINNEIENQNSDDNTSQNGRPIVDVLLNDNPDKTELENNCLLQNNDTINYDNVKTDSDIVLNTTTNNNIVQTDNVNNVLETDSHQEISENDNIRSEITDKVGDQNDIDDDKVINDIPIAEFSTRKKSTRLRKRKVSKYSDKDDSDFVCSDTEDTNNGKIKFAGHECYICFKLFKTKEDLKVHCGEHFDICNEKMLKKCPFCGYVTNLNIKKHVENVHKIYINYSYGHITEKKSSNGSKYVFELSNDRELEVIPSISNLNKIACMKNDEKNRQNKNKFIGRTKLVKKGGEWIVEKQAVSLNNEYLLPEFTKEEYENLKKLKIQGDTYTDRLKKLSILAKKRGVKMLFPCGGCEKICQSLAALKLHNRKHETNPKGYRPKVWINRRIEYKMINRKNKKNSINEKVYKGPVREIPVKDSGIQSVPSENRFASPQPVKNKHKCDKKLIEFYKSNIKGGDIEFWQFLKIFNRMSRENVNDFEDLENRNDFGLHYKTPKQPVTTESEPTITEVAPVFTEPVHSKNEPVITKKVGKRKKIVSKKFTRAIMISKKEYMRRKDIKDQMRRKLAEDRDLS